MKKSHLVIVSIIGIFTVGISGMLYANQSENYALNVNSTTENPLGIKGKVVYESGHQVVCLVGCSILPAPHLFLSSTKGAQFVSYEVCVGSSCKRDVIENGLYVNLSNVPPDYSGTSGIQLSPINLGRMPWNIGDTAHIIIKAFPATLEPNTVIIRQPERIMVVDLGESKITLSDAEKEICAKNNGQWFNSTNRCVFVQKTP